MHPEDHSLIRYRYGFNGQERTEELGQNHYTAKFWEYDSRVVLRWNTAPKPFVGLSPYAINGGNPILNYDPLGDIFKIGNKDLKSDVKSVAKNKNQDYITFTKDGTVGIDFGDLSQKKIDKIIKKDEGISLIKNLIEAKDSEGKAEHFFFEASNRREGIHEGKAFNKSGAFYLKACHVLR